MLDHEPLILSNCKHEMPFQDFCIISDTQETEPHFRKKQNALQLATYTRNRAPLTN